MQGEEYAPTGAVSGPSLDIAAALSVAVSDGPPAFLAITDAETLRGQIVRRRVRLRGGAA